jgi:hypothetical protein
MYCVSPTLSHQRRGSRFKKVSKLMLNGMQLLDEIGCVQRKSKRQLVQLLSSLEMFLLGKPWELLLPRVIFGNLFFPMLSSKVISISYLCNVVFLLTIERQSLSADFVVCSFFW